MKPLKLILAATGMAVIVLCAIWYYYAPSTPGEIAEVAGQIGDSFGAVTSILTLFALFVLLDTFHLQKDELKKAIGFMAEQSKINKEQLTYNIVFQLCEQYRGIVENTSITERGVYSGSKGIVFPDVVYKGREGFRHIISHLPDNGKIIEAAQQEFSLYAGCFRLLHRIFKFIENETDNKKERQKYARIPRAMLSDLELEALLINCLTDRGEGMKSFVEEYEIFNNYVPTGLPMPLAVDLCREYSQGAFGDNPFYARKVKGETPPE